MPQTNPDAIKCPKCLKRASGPYPNGLCRACYDTQRILFPKDLKDKVRMAQSTGDWKSLADSLTDTIQAVASGEIKATAAQGSMLKHIMDRGYGRVNKSQEDKLGPVGVVVLPALGDGETSQVCKKCIELHKLHHNEQ